MVECKRCGVCCGPLMSLYVEDDDIERWRKIGREDLIERVEWEKHNVIWIGHRVVSIQTYRELSRCYYLRFLSNGLAQCSIHDVKPRICRRYQPATSSLCRLYKGEG